MIEKVAEAIYKANKGSHVNFRILASYHRAKYKKIAKAAIAAMREPPVDRGEIYNNVWQDMIDAALKE